MCSKYEVNVWKSGKDKEKKARQPPEKGNLQEGKKRAISKSTLLGKIAKGLHNRWKKNTEEGKAKERTNPS